MRNIYIIALFAGIVFVPNLTASQPLESFELGVTRPKTSAPPTDGSQSQFEIENKDKNKTLLKKRESLMLLEKLAARGFANGVGIAETLNAMTGTNIVKKTLSDSMKKSPKVENSKIIEELILEKVTQIHNIYNEIYLRFGKAPKPLPALSYESQLDSQFSSLEQTQNAYINLLEQQAKAIGNQLSRAIYQKKINKLKSDFQASNKTLENDYYKLLRSIQ